MSNEAAGSSWCEVLIVAGGYNMYPKDIDERLFARSSS